MLGEHRHWGHTGFRFCDLCVVSPAVSPHENRGSERKKPSSPVIAEAHEKANLSKDAALARWQLCRERCPLESGDPPAELRSQPWWYGTGSGVILAREAGHMALRSWDVLRPLTVSQN